MIVTKGLLWLLLAVAVMANVRYDKHQVFRLKPEDHKQLEALSKMEKETQGVSCVWSNIKQWKKSITYIHRNVYHRHWFCVTFLCCARLLDFRTLMTCHWSAWIAWKTWYFHSLSLHGLYILFPFTFTENKWKSLPQSRCVRNAERCASLA